MSRYTRIIAPPKSSISSAISGEFSPGCSASAATTASVGGMQNDRYAAGLAA